MSKNVLLLFLLLFSACYPQLLDTKSTDRKQTLLHFIVSIVQEKYSDVQAFYTELHFLDKAALGEHIYNNTNKEAQIKTKSW